jgi:hypothetical protein
MTLNRKYFIGVLVVFIVGISILLWFTGVLEGFETPETVRVFDLLTRSYITRFKDEKFPKCSSSQIIMVAHPTEEPHCGTITGDIYDMSKCLISTTDQYNYTVTCPTTIDTPPSDDIGTSISETQFTPSISDQISNMITNGGLLKELQARIPITGPPNQTTVSSLKIISKPEPACSKLTNGATPTPSNNSSSVSNQSTGSSSTSQSNGNNGSTSVTNSVSTHGTGQGDYDKSRSKVKGIPSDSIFNFAEKIHYNSQSTNDTGSDDMTPGHYNPVGNPMGTTTQSNGKQVTNTYVNVPFPFLPSFKAS